MPMRLTEDEEKECLTRLAVGDMSARKSLIEHNLRLVAFVAKGFDSGQVALEDLISIGTIGLCKAVDGFDLSCGVKFSTYAVKCIRNEIVKGIRCEPTNTISFEEPVCGAGDDEICLRDTIGTEEDSVVNHILRPEQYAALEAALDSLDEIDRKILTLKFGLGGLQSMKQSQIAKLLGLSRQSICRHKLLALEKLRETMEMGGFTGPVS